jgi:hypothetical protein
MNDEYVTPFYFELSSYDKERVSNSHDWALDRYNHYRKKGHSPADALQYTLAWAKNMTEQSQRRLGHETGCRSWAERSPGQDRVVGVE